MKQQFIENGYEIVSLEEKADIYIINTCTVTNMSDRKSRQMIRRVKHENPKAIIVAVGCYVQVAKNELENIKEIDLVLGNNEKKEIVKQVEEYIKNKEKKQIITDVMQKKEFVDFGQTTYTDKTRAVIKVQDGCDRFCTYCIIPYARGRVRSRNMKSIIKEIEQIAKNGIKEVVITGIHVASYGKDFKENISLIDLLEKINNIEGIERIRLGSLEPTIITKEFVNRLKNLNKICNHFHLSLQSGCDETLERMNRKYKAEEFENCIKLLRENFKDVMLTADVIVGFPGETKEEFQKTVQFLEMVGFYKIHVFKYSKRKGTKAANMDNQVDGNIKEERSKKIIEISNHYGQKYNEEMLNTKQSVLVEEKEGEFWKGHTTNYVLVKIKSKQDLENKIVTTYIKEYKNNELIGDCKDN